MAKDKKSVLLYCDIIHTVSKLTDEEAGILFKHYLEYINDLNPTPKSNLIDIVFEPIKQNLKRDLKKWEEKSVRNSQTAKARWAKQNDANVCERIKTDAKDADKDIVTDKDKVIDKDIFSFKNELLKYGFKKNLVDEWLKVRKAKKAVNTETAFVKFILEIEKRNCDINTTLETIVSNSWSGFRWEWLDNLNKNSNGKQSTFNAAVNF